MIFPYICLHRFISPQEIRAPFGHQTIKARCSFKCHNRRKSRHLQWVSRTITFKIIQIKILFFIPTNRNNRAFLVKSRVFLGSKQPDDKCKLQNQDRRNAPHKARVLGLVVKRIHTRPAADGAADERDEKERTLADTPRLQLGAPLVHAHQAKTRQVDGEQIRDERHDPPRFGQRTSLPSIKTPVMPRFARPVRAY